MFFLFFADASIICKARLQAFDYYNQQIVFSSIHISERCPHQQRILFTVNCAEQCQQETQRTV